MVLQHFLQIKGCSVETPHDHPLLFVQGFMEYSYLFYGYYNNTLVEDGDFWYNIPLAYLLAAVFYFAFCFICIIAR